MGSLLGDGQSRIFDRQLILKDDEKVTVRILNPQEPAPPIWTHTARDAQGRFLDVLCVGSMQGCPMCAVNKEPEFANLENRDRPYPIRKRYAKAVWVFDRQKALLLIGAEVWKNIDTLHTTFGSVEGHNIVVARLRRDRVQYIVHDGGTAEFTLPAGIPIPAAQEYIDWLKENLTLIKIAKPVPGQPVLASAPAGGTSVMDVAKNAPAQSAPVTPPPATPPPAQPQPAAPQPQASQPSADNPDHKKLVEEMKQLIHMKLDATELSRCMKEVTSRTSRMTEFNVEELNQLIAKYKEVVKKAI